MDEIIIEFTNDYMTPEHRETCLNIIDLLQQLDYLEVESVIIEWINKSESLGIDNVVDSIVRYLNDCLAQVYKSFGIKINDDVNYTVRYETLLSLLELEYLEDKESAFNTLKNSHSVSEGLADLLESVTGENSDTYLDMFEEVSPSLVSRLIAIYSKTNTEYEEDKDAEDELLLTKVKINLFKAFRSFTHDEMGPLGLKFKQDFPFMLPFTSYLEMFIDQKETIKEEEIAKSIVLAALISDSKEDPITTVANNLEFLDENLGIATRLEKAAKQISVQFQEYLNEQRKPA